ncbi:vesicular glutamate transporter 3-like [Chrysoperla carnea]|uniref:vesicular glutamate transporter 3-like n=1 Tax=Chrysoperla carnea TaxID=189513 RepID=UPI001D0974F1|nr:vesicular glutamate transporter 3-like [Chrysoperla carnea]
MDSDTGSKDQTLIFMTHWQRTNLLGSFFYGYILTPVLGGYLSGVYGGKKVLSGSVFISSVLSLLTPAVAKINFYALLAVRIALGIAQGVMFPCVYTILGKWSPPWERSRLLITIFSGTFIGTAVSMPLAGVICDTIGWPWVFYLCGLCGCIWCISWICLVSESPRTDTKIKPAELIILQEALNNLTEHLDLQTPWKRIFLSLPLWAINAAQIAHSYLFFLLITHFPSYMEDMYDYDIQRVGVYSAIPHLVITINSLLGAYLADIFIKKKYLSPTATRKLFTCTALLFMAMMSFFNIIWRTPLGSLTCAILMDGIGTVGWAGFCVNFFDICPQFAHITMGISTTFAGVSGIIMTMLVTHFVHNESVNNTYKDKPNDNKTSDEKTSNEKTYDEEISQEKTSNEQKSDEKTTNGQTSDEKISDRTKSEKITNAKTIDDETSSKKIYN